MKLRNASSLNSTPFPASPSPLLSLNELSYCDRGCDRPADNDLQVSSKGVQPCDSLMAVLGEPRVCILCATLKILSFLEFPGVSVVGNTAFTAEEL